jgi:hypothetical protein
MSGSGRGEFTWDARKAQRNWQIHRVSFDEATEAFSDPFSTAKFDPDHSAGEDRWVLTGASHRDRLVTVVFTVRVGSIRLISARRATKRERHDYENIFEKEAE